jgi:hypothetical protein
MKKVRGGPSECSELEGSRRRTTGLEVSSYLKLKSQGFLGGDGHILDAKCPCGKDA